MDFWKILSLITTAGVLWLVYQKRKETTPTASTINAPPNRPQTEEEEIAAMLGADN